MIRIPTDESVAVLTGAGISVSSGLAPFRGPGGVWDDIDIEQVATADAWRHDPDRVRQFIDHMREVAFSAEPSAAHRALARAEQARTGAARFDLITQNVDGLHVKAGSRNVHEIHGSLRTEICERCARQLPVPAPRSCPCGGTMRPHVVLFGELLPQNAVTASLRALRACRWFVAVGTSGVVWPAASFVLEARANGATCINVNVEPSGNDAFDEELVGAADAVVPELFGV